MRGIIIILQLVTVKATKTLLRLLETNNNKTEQKEKKSFAGKYIYTLIGEKKKKRNIHRQKEKIIFETLIL